jgi:hypothetical protein
LYIIVQRGIKGYGVNHKFIHGRGANSACDRLINFKAFDKICQ